MASKTGDSSSEASALGEGGGNIMDDGELIDEDEESEDNKEEDDSRDEEKANVLGGSVASPAFALLVGKFEDPKDGTTTPVRVPLTRLPATLGRTHKTTDSKFYGLGKAKALSRLHCLIFYRDAVGGRLGQYGEDSDDETLVYQPKVKKEHDKSNEGEGENNDVIRPNAESKLPESGFFAIECLGKNKIIVGGRRVDQSQVALLEHGTTIKLASYSLYFLLPTDCSSSKVTIMKVPNPAYEEYQRKRALEWTSTGGDGDDDSSTAPSVKKPRPSCSATGIGAELEALPTETLLSRITEACKLDQWDRKHQMLGTAVAIHAVRDAARSAELQTVAKEHGGVARGEVLEWIEKSPVYSKWVRQMLGKLEEKSYRSNISKAIIRAGYQRSGTTGRHVRWALPEGIPSATGPPAEEKGKDRTKEGVDRESQPLGSKAHPNTGGGAKNEETKRESNVSKGQSTTASGHDERKSKVDAPKGKKPKPRARKKKDPGAPKKATTSFMYFSGAVRPSIKEQNPEASFCDMGKLVGKAWEKVSAEEKVKYEALADADKVRYKEEKEAYEMKKKEKVEIADDNDNKVDGSDGSNDEDDAEGDGEQMNSDNDDSNQDDDEDGSDESD